VLRAVPQQQDALHLLGVVALQSGRLADAETSIRAALAVAPAEPTFWNNLGATYRAGGRLADAASCFERAVTHLPTYPEAWSALADVRAGLGDAAGEAVALEQLTTLAPDDARGWGRRGVLAYQSGQLADAAVLFERAVAIQPDDVGTLNNLGIVLLLLGRSPEAEATLRRALAIQPGSPSTLNNLGTVLVAQSRWAEAEQVLRQVVTATPVDPNGWTNLGHALKGLERFADAAASYERALAVQAELPAALVGLGDAWQGQDELERAVAAYERALVLTPDDPETLDHLGVALRRLDRLAEAADCFSRSLARRPDSVETWDHLAHTLQQLGRLRESADAYRRALVLAPDRPDVHTTLIYVLDHLDDAEDEAVEERRRWAGRFGRPDPAIRPTRPTDPDPERPLRVGYVSADFSHHSSVFATLPIVEGHDRLRVTVVCYSGVTAPDAMTDRFRRSADLWRDAAELSDAELAAQIRADQIDILVDLSGFTNGNRLPVFGRRPAPVQVTAWGYATGTGMDAMDYLLSDPILTPPESRSTYVEQVVDLPSFLCYAPVQEYPPIAPPPMVQRGYATFGAFNRLAKLSAVTIEAWAAILRAVPGSRLVVKTGQPGPDPARERLVDALVALGVERDRVEPRGSTPRLEHLAAHADVDLMLDSIPHGGGITTLDALLMGVPVVTLLGQRPPGRASASFLTTLGLPDLIARSVDDYVSIAARAAADSERLVRERASLRERLLASPIGDTRGYVRAVEDVYQELWRRCCSESAVNR
jgi:predicted O-linked N-acetylglucosamine transferase (SPINDLY family)